MVILVKSRVKWAAQSCFHTKYAQNQAKYAKLGRKQVIFSEKEAFLGENGDILGKIKDNSRKNVILTEKT